jgi:transcription initiation factor TFIID TATA-box-binding protein
MKWKNTNKQTKKKSLTNISCAENLFVEQDYIMRCCTSQNEAQVHNLVGTCKVVHNMSSLNLQAVSDMLPNAVFEKQKFAAITIRLGKPTCTVLLFTSGKMVLTGCKSLLDCILASKIVADLLRKVFPGNDFKLDMIKIQNIVGNALVHMKQNEELDLPRFYTDFNIYSTYQPNMFPGLIYRPTALPIVLLIFFSGKVVITGAKNMQDVYSGWTSIFLLLQQYVSAKSNIKNFKNVSEGKKITSKVCRTHQAAKNKRLNTRTTRTTRT